MVYVNVAGQISGPYSAEQIRSFVHNGQLTPDSLLSKSQEGPWKQAGQVKKLQALFQSSNSPQKSSLQPPAASVSTSIESVANQGPHSPNVYVQVVTPETQRTKNTPESQIWAGGPSQVVNLKTYILCIIFFWLIVPIFVGIWRFLVTNSVRYELTTQRLRTDWGVFSKRSDEVELYRVKDISFRQSFFERIFGLASLPITTSDKTHPYQCILSINAKQARTLREQLRSCVEELRDRKGVREMDWAS